MVDCLTINFRKMKLPKLFLIALVIMAFSACRDTTPADKPHNPETPKALQGETKSSISRISDYRSGDLVEEIYSNMLEKRVDLKNLEDEIAAHSPKQNDSLQKYHRYMVKSTLYYGSANQAISTITDSVLKKQMLDIILSSNNRQKNRVAVINKMIAGLNKNDSTLENYHKVLKVMITLPVMEKFQQDELPDTKALRTLGAEKNRLIERTKKLTPKIN